MDTFFDISTAEIADHCRTEMQQETGLLQARTHWQGPRGGQLTFTDYFLDGFQLGHMSGRLTEPLRAELNVHQPWVGMLYQLEGDLHSKSCARRPLRLGANRQNVVGDETTRNHYTFQPQQEAYQLFSVHLTHECFHKLIGSNAEWLGVHERWLSRPDPFVMLPDGLLATPAAQIAIQQILNCPYSGPLKKMFLEARFLDLFIAQQEEFTRAVTRLSSPERDLFYGIRHYLDEHYANPPSLLELARLFGTNDFKLKKGFRQLFGTTVFGYVAERRLTVAQQLLSLTDQPVQEIAESVGFANPAHFATAFRKKFGVAPSQVRRDPALIKAAAENVELKAASMLVA
ncbi:AraC family transcriptional regulator [Hymenobacter sp. 15J16-1T3B]|uniref:helix-turn-helix transcriptional regulator n=1 Tax=Hymenobacter sp. 15J16-1T3B TaxID=2886941 RepID=UPI001D12663E|nr:AraC family transcriptional regulator [Hymenobacter sp. 15J16-1T3B]MCC3156194.1 AraC family transcriptional regulator [Hymenobacter sp. 15J16-1T3B]